MRAIFASLENACLQDPGGSVPMTDVDPEDAVKNSTLKKAAAMLEDEGPSE